MKNSRGRVILVSACLIGSLLVSVGSALAAFSFSWFSNLDVVDQAFKGQTFGAYYARGDGSKSNPYVIKTPTHMYNFAWLQYLGTYNKDTNGDGVIEETYFKLEGSEDSNGNSVIDMSGWVLPPIGTETNPFVGNFNGNNTIVKNLTVSNSFSDYATHPNYNGNGSKMDESTFVSPAIIGYFGVIGALDGQTYEYTSNIAVTGASYVEANLVYDTYVDNITIQNKTTNQELLAGLLAGYVNAPIYQSGVGYGKFDFAEGTKNLSDSNKPSGSTINGVSNYSIIGAYNPDKFEYKGLPSSDGGSGSDNDFGGSIDMLTFARRISYIKNSAPSSNNYHASFGTTTTGGYSWTATSTYTDLESGSYLPVNVDMDATGLADVTGEKDTSTSYYSSHTEEPIAKTNSGYITGGLTRTRVQYCNKDAQGIKNAVKRVSGTSTSNNNLDLFSDDAGKVISMDKLKSNIGFLTYYNGRVCAIYDDDDKDFVQSSNFVYKVNGVDVKGDDKSYVDSSAFVKYSSVKNNFLTMIYESTNAYFNNGGDKAYGVYLEGIRLQQWTKDTTFQANVEWLGENKDVTFHNNGIQFELKKDGYITALVSKFDASGLFSFYNFYSVDNLTDANLTKINTIHKDSSGNITYNESNSSTKIFDFSAITTTNTGLYSSQVFYFEIPIKKGIYFLSSYGSSYSSGYYPYFLYLDIGANGGDSGDDTPSTSETADIDFVYYDSDKKLVKITSDGKYVNSDVVFQVNSGASGVITFKRTYENEVSIVYYYLPASSTTVVTPTVGKSGKSEKSDTELAEN